MTTRATSRPRALLAALVAGLTIWACMLAWSPLLEGPGHEVPLLIAVVAVGLTGVTGRSLGLPTLGVGLLHVVVGSAAVLLLTTGAQWSEFTTVISDSVESARTYTAPVPAEVPPVWPLFLVVGTVAAALLDLVALSSRRVALGALVVLGLHLVPANLAVAVDWWVFPVVAVGYLTLLHLDADDLVLRWGSARAEPSSTRRSDPDGSSDDTATLSQLPGRGTASAVRIGAVAVVGAIGTAAVLSSVLPHSPVRPWTPGSGSGGQVSLTSPLVDMRRDLDRGANIALMVVESERRPTYLRHAVLPEFDGTEWSAGERSAVALPQDGSELPLAGVDPLLRRTERELAFTAANAFRSRWLPLMPLTSRVEADGDWRWDRQTSDVASFDADLTTSGATWNATGVELEYIASMLEEAPSGVDEVPTVFSSLPADLPRSVRTWAREVTAGETSRFDQALALQTWFRTEFDYSLDQVETVDNEALVEFLSPAGRVGYCEQFAAAMAVMARTLDIPSRVAVGFLEPRRVGVREWEFSSHDLHAWPELYFPGSGWVRFEPTPASRASGVPDYTEEQETPAPGPSPTPTESAEPTAPSPSAEEPEAAPAPSADTPADEGVAWGMVAAWVAGLLVLAAALVAPQWLRRRRREQRFEEGEAEALWAELRDSAVDLGHDWPTGRSPRATGAVVAGWMTGADGVDVPATDHVDRLVAGVEQQRFARPGAVATATRSISASDVRACVEALSARRGRADRWRARWLPRSLVRRHGSRRRRGVQ